MELLQDKDQSEERIDGEPTRIKHKSLLRLMHVKVTMHPLKKKIAIGQDQASRYDETYKSLLGHISEHFDHRVHAAVKYKDKSIDMNLLTNPTAPTKPNPTDNTRTVLDKDEEEFIE